MTNGEKITALLKPREDQIKIFSNFVEIEIQNLDINFSCGLDWWYAEYKEPTTKNDLGVDCISRQTVLDLINADWKYENLEIEINNLPSVTPQEPKIGKVIKMRDATPEEKESINKYIKSISKPIGINFWNLEQKSTFDELRAEVTILQHRCYALTKGTMCAFCRYECEYKPESEVKE